MTNISISNNRMKDIPEVDDKFINNVNDKISVI